MLRTLSLILRGIRELGLAPTWDSVRYQIRQTRHTLRFGHPRPSYPPAPSRIVRPGPVTAYACHNRAVTITCASGSYALTPLAPDLIRVRFEPPSGAGGPPRPSYAVATPEDAWPPCPFNIVDTETAVDLKTPRLTCRVLKDSGRIRFLDPRGRLINEDADGVGLHPDGPVVCHKRIQPDEHFYGLGERTGGLDRRGRVFETWNSDPQTYQSDQDPIYLCIPFLLGLHSRGEQGYGLFFDNTFRGQFDLGASDPEVASFGALGGDLCYTFIYGPALTTVLERYTTLTGRMPLPPRWALGYHQSRWGYHPDERVRQLAADFRHNHDVPCDAIHLDITHMDGHRCFTWDPKGFPDPAGLIAGLHREGFKVVVILDPGIKVDPSYRVFQSGLEEGVFSTTPDGEPLTAPVWPGDCHFPDFTAPRVRAWWGDLLETLTDVGVDGVWNDMNEPSIFGPEGTTFPDVVRHDLDGRPGDHAEAHNVYGMQMARATAEGLARLRPDARPFSLTRSGWAGVQRYALSWTGDNASTWEHLWLTMPMVLNLGLSGLAFTGPDTGGFYGFPEGELFTRWLQMSVFLPLLRTHAHLHSPDQEPWSWGEPYLSINRRWIEHRYRLLPYLYTALWQCAQTGMPIARPLLLAYQDHCATHTLDDQFLCGDHLLIAPLTEEGTTRRSVYLPSGTWYDAWTDQRYSGPTRLTVDTPLERIPIFVRAGAVVPLGPPLRYVGERPIDRLTLHLYPAADGEPSEDKSPLYQDDGETWAFRDGDYLLTHFLLASEGHPPAHLELRRETEGCYQPPVAGFDIVVHGIEHLPRAATADGNPVGEYALDRSGHAVRLSLGPFDHLAIEWPQSVQHPST